MNGARVATSLPHRSRRVPRSRRRTVCFRAAFRVALRGVAFGVMAIGVIGIGEMALAPGGGTGSHAFAQGDLGGDPASAERVRSAVERVLADVDFRHLRPKGPRGSVEREDSLWPDWIQRFFRWLADSFEFDIDPSAASGAGSLLQVLVWIVIAVAVFFLVMFIVRALRARTPAGDSGVVATEQLDELLLEPEGPPGDLSVDEWLARASASAEAGDLRQAIRYTLFAGRSFLERSGRIRFRRGLTNRDYLRVSRRDHGEREAFSVLSLHFEEVFFGRRDATRERFVDCVERVREAFDESSLAR